MGKKGQFRDLKSLALMAVVILVVASIFLLVTRKSTPQLTSPLEQAWFGKCKSMGYSLIDENFKTITKDTMLDTGVGKPSFDIVINRCGRCLGKEKGEYIIYLYDKDEDGKPDKCETTVGPTTLKQWEKQCEGEGVEGKYISTGPRCCLSGLDNDWCKEAVK